MALNDGFIKPWGLKRCKTKEQMITSEDKLSAGILLSHNKEQFKRQSLGSKTNKH